MTQGILNAKDFGAKGDGVTDDTNDLLKWLGAVGGGTYEHPPDAYPHCGFLPAGHYRTTRTIHISIGTKICGVPFNSVIEPATTIGVTQESGSMLEGIVIRGNNAPPGSIGLKIHQCDERPESIPINTGVTRDVTAAGYASKDSIGVLIGKVVGWNFDACRFQDSFHGVKFSTRVTP